MLGLRPDADPYYQSIRTNAPAFKKSSKFASKLTGRFFVSGISGSFKKHQKLVADIQEQEEKEKAENAEQNFLLPQKSKKIIYSYQPVLVKRQREELRKDAEKLVELEEKLQEVERRLFI
jgi:uncharacterized membrane protein